MNKGSYKTKELSDIQVLLILFLIIVSGRALWIALNWMIAWWGRNGDTVISITGWTLLSFGLLALGIFLYGHWKATVEAHRKERQRRARPIFPFLQLRDKVVEASAIAAKMKKVANTFLVVTREHLQEDMVTLARLPEGSGYSDAAYHLNRRITASNEHIDRVVANCDRLQSVEATLAAIGKGISYTIYNEDKFGVVSKSDLEELEASVCQLHLIRDHLDEWSAVGIAGAWREYGSDLAEFSLDLREVRMELLNRKV